MCALLIYILKLGLKIIYAPLKLLKSKNQIVYLSRQSNEKSIDIRLLEQAVTEQNKDVKQIFRLRTIDEGFVAKIKYCFSVIGDMYYLATSKVAVTDTYSISVSCLNHKKDLKIIQMWHALGAIKKFGLQAVGTKEGRDESISKAMCMHKNYSYVMAPSVESAKFYMKAFGVERDKIKICPMPRVDFLLDGKSKSAQFFSLNPGMSHKKIILYLPTFRSREQYISQMLKTELEDKEDYQLIISTHPLSTARVEEKYRPNGSFTSFDLMKIADIIITDYSACAFEASLLMKPLYFFTPDYDEYLRDRGMNVDLKEEIPSAVYEQADTLVNAIQNESYDFNALYQFKEKYIENTKSNNAAILAKFVLMQLDN